MGRLRTPKPGDVVTARTPGVYDLDEAEYLADPALSQSECRKLLACPYRYRYDRDAHIERHSDAFDFGKAVHKLVLGAGNGIIIVEADNWRTADARDIRDQARAAGAIPLLAADHTTAQAMAAAVHAHPFAAALLHPDRGGIPERSVMWTDARTGVACRARFDLLPPVPVDGRRLVAVDYKTAVDASPRAFGRVAASYDYPMQHAWYVDGLRALFGVDAAFLFIVQEKDPPYLVNVVELDARAVAIGRDRCRHALDVFVECSASGVWPGYGDKGTSVSLPRWAELQHDDDVADWSADEESEPW